MLNGCLANSLLFRYWNKGGMLTLLFSLSLSFSPSHLYCSSLQHVLSILISREKWGGREERGERTSWNHHLVIWQTEVKPTCQDGVQADLNIIYLSIMGWSLPLMASSLVEGTFSSPLLWCNNVYFSLILFLCFQLSFYQHTEQLIFSMGQNLFSL